LGIDELRLAALLHDIGKPASWSRGRRWSEHIYDTYDIVSALLGEDIAWKAMRHHTGASYDRKYMPHSDEEWIIWLADKISSGLDRQEDAATVSRRPKPPFTLTHPLSRGDKALYRYSAQDLKKRASSLYESLESAVKDSYKETYLGLDLFPICCAS